MAKVHTIRRQIKAVNSVKQITRAMEMVSASKLRRAQEATLRSRLYVIEAREALARMYRATRKNLDHPLFKKRPLQSALTIIFTSDRGLVGTFNQYLFRELLAREQPMKVIAVGQKGAQFVAKHGDKFDLVAAYTNWPTPPTLNEVRPIVQTVIEGYTKQEFDEVHLLYTNFTSISQQEVIKQLLLPVQPEIIAAPDYANLELADHILVEPSPQAAVDYILPRILEMQVLQASLEASASEHSTRMLAMKNATDSASDLIDGLTLTYNGARQAAITQELAEITSGAAALT